MLCTQDRGPISDKTPNVTDNLSFAKTLILIILKEDSQIL